MTTFIQILSTATPDSSPSVMVVTEHERHLFNAGEGTQRLCMEHRVRIVKTDNVFITHLNADTVGGLPGLVLTLGEGNKKKINLHGPPGTKAYCAAARTFMRPDACTVTCDEPEAGDIETLFSTTEIRIHKLLVTARAAAAPAAIPQEQGGNASLSSSDGFSSPHAKRVRLSVAEEEAAEPGNGSSGGDGAGIVGSSGIVGDGSNGGASCMCYVCETPESPGKFNVARAVELNIPRGPLYAQLKNGAAVTLPDGRVIQPGEVVGDSVPPASAAIIACPTLDLVSALAAHPHWQRYLQPAPPPAAATATAAAKAGIAAGRLRFLIHLAPEEVLITPAYQAWCRSFGPAVAHIVAGTSQRCGAHTPFLAALATARRLNNVCPDVFPVPRQFIESTNIRKSCKSLPRGAAADSVALSAGASAAATLPAATTMLAGPCSYVLDFGGSAVVPAAPLLKCHLLPPARIRIDASEALAAERLTLEDETQATRQLGNSVAASLPAALKQLAAARAAAAMAAAGGGGGPMFRCPAAAAAAAAAAAKAIADAEAAAAPAAPATFHNGNGHNDAGNGGLTSGGAMLPLPVGLEAVDAAALGRAALLRAAEGIELAFLGTGSAMPSKYRNVSGIYLKLNDAGDGMLMDCGEGTMGQLWRMFGDGGSSSGSRLSDIGGGGGSGGGGGGGGSGGGSGSSGGGGGGGGGGAVLRGLRAVWISHHHADHHLGLVRVVAERNKALAVAATVGTGAVPPEPLLVIGPGSVGRWLQGYEAVVAASSGAGSALASPEAGYVFVDIASTADAGGWQARAEWLEQRLGLTQLRSVPVDHCSQAYGLVLRHRQGWKLVYSGDTRPCARLVAAGAGATVLVHEATFDDSKAHEALARRHSTTSEALDVARQMGAYRVLLTHFSQRYPKLPQMPTGQSGRVAVAFDFMKVRLPDLQWVPALMPALQCLFPDEAADMEAAESAKMRVGDDNSSLGGSVGTPSPKAATGRKDG